MITRIARDPVIIQGERVAALRALTKEVALAMQADFVGFWSYDAERSQICSEANYDRNKNLWTDGFVLKRMDAPKYFSAIENEKVLPVDDCFSSPHTAEFRDSYCKVFDVQSLIDVPVLFDGEVVGIICCEITGVKRDWSSEDKFFAMFAADFAGRVLEAEERRAFSRQIERENFRLSEAQLKGLLASFPIPTVMLDSESRIISVSESWLEHYKFSAANPVGMKMWEAHDQYEQVWIDRILRAQKGEILSQDEELISVGEVNIWISWELRPWKNLKGENAGIVIICEDITYRKDTEMKLRHTAKMSALGEMAGGIAHEINNPLSILKGFVDLMQKNLTRGQFDADVFRGYLEKSSSTINRISRIVQSMKRVSRETSQDNMQLASLNSLIEESLDFVQEKFRYNSIELKKTLLPDDIQVLCRPVEISQVLLNLLTNAFHALPQGGWVQISAEKTSSHVRILISDSGKGIPKDIRDKIFQPFFTTKDIGKGTGLGLSISRTMMQNHNGSLYLDESKSETTFVLELPLSA